MKIFEIGSGPLSECNHLLARMYAATISESVAPKPTYQWMISVLSLILQINYVPMVEKLPYTSPLFLLYEL